MADTLSRENVSIPRVETEVNQPPAPSSSAAVSESNSDKKGKSNNQVGKKSSKGNGNTNKPSDNKDNDGDKNDSKANDDNGSNENEDNNLNNDADSNQLVASKNGSGNKKKDSSGKKLAKRAGKAAAETVGKWVLSKALLNMLRQMFMALIGSFVQAVTGILSAIWNTIVAAVQTIISTISSLISVSVAVAITIVAGGAVTIVVAAYMFVASFFSDDNAAREAPIEEAVEEVDCDAAEKEAFEPADETLSDVVTKQNENAKFIYSTLKTYGISDSQIAGVLGNWSTESGIDPTGVEGFYGNDCKYKVSDDYGSNSFQAGKWSKKNATESFDNLSKYTNDYMDWYGRDRLHIEGYMVNRDGKTYAMCGLGLGQFTGDNAYKLFALSKASGLPWYELKLQLAYSLGDNSDVAYRAGFFENWKSDTGKSATEYARDFLKNWEGGDPDVSYTHFSDRAEAAEKWNDRIEKGELKVDKSFAESVFSMANTSAKQGDAKLTEEANKKCGSKNKRSFSGVTSVDIMGEPNGASGGNGKVYMSMCSDSSHTCGSKANTTNFPEYMSNLLSKVIGSDGNIKPELIQGETGKVKLDSTGQDCWVGQCVRWSATRITSYVAAKYDRYVTISRFGDGGSPWHDGDCLGAPALGDIGQTPTADCVFSENLSGAGHTGYVEYVCPNGGLITSETNDNADSESFYVYYVPPERYSQWKFFSVDDIFEANQDNNIWERRHTG